MILSRKVLLTAKHFFGGALGERLREQWCLIFFKNEESTLNSVNANFFIYLLNTLPLKNKITQKRVCMSI